MRARVLSRYDETVNPRRITPGAVKILAQECGFELAGVAPAAAPEDDFARFERWIGQGMAGKMGYLTGRRAALRRDARNLLPAARSVICVGKLYNRETPPVASGDGRGVISRYALGRDYHDAIPRALERLAEKLLAIEPFEYKICVDTAPLLERSYARQAGLGWIGRNTCLINQPLGSWFLLGEIVTSLELAPDSPPADRCGTCTRCIDACPTDAIVPSVFGGLYGAGQGSAEYTLDARRCISYLNIELKGEIPEEHRGAMGPHVFGCDICQQVCPWNARAPFTTDPEFAPVMDAAPPLDDLARLSESDFQETYGGTPVKRPRYEGFLRNVAVAMGASGAARFREPLERLAARESEVVGAHARWALERLNSPAEAAPVERTVSAQASAKDVAECVEI